MRHSHDRVLDRPSPRHFRTAREDPERLSSPCGVGHEVPEHLQRRRRDVRPSRTSEVYEHLDTTAASVPTIVSEAFTRHGVVHQPQSAGNLFSLFFTDRPVRTYDDAKVQNTNVFADLFHAMLDNGVSLPPSAYETWFVSAAHTDDDLAIIERAANTAARRAARHQ